MARVLSIVLSVLLAACSSTRTTAPQSRDGRPAVLVVAPANDAEAAVQRAIEDPGVHVVHFWAPWCDNSIAELQQGWYEVVEANPDVDFTFVTVWNDGGDGRDVLQRYAIPERVTVLTQSDGRAEELRRKTFLGLPMTWLPTTWVFHEGGTLAFAFNYGEMTMAQLQGAIESAGREW